VVEPALVGLQYRAGHLRRPGDAPLGQPGHQERQHVPAVADRPGRVAPGGHVLAELPDQAGEPGQVRPVTRDQRRGPVLALAGHRAPPAAAARTDAGVHTTQLDYYKAPQDPKFKWSLQTLTDRRGNTVGFACERGIQEMPWRSSTT
jgi:hypothetical protein